MSTKPPIAAITPSAIWRMPFTGAAESSLGLLGELRRAGRRPCGARARRRRDLELAERVRDLARRGRRPASCARRRSPVRRRRRSASRPRGRRRRRGRARGTRAKVALVRSSATSSASSAPSAAVDASVSMVRDSSPGFIGPPQPDTGAATATRANARRRTAASSQADSGVPSGGRRRLSLRAVADIAGAARTAARGGGGRMGRGRRVVLVEAGDEIPVPGRGDRTYPFRAHSEYLYLTDRERPGGVLAFDPGRGLDRVRASRSPPRSSSGRGSRATARACRRARGRWTSWRGGCRAARAPARRRPTMPTSSCGTS